MTVYDAAWYDWAMTEPAAPAMLPLESSPWLSVYSEVAAWVDPNEEVVDLGCGTGRFIELLYRQGHYARVTGVDWSSAALTEAASYARTRDAGPPDPVWQRSSLEEWRPDPLRAGNTVYTCMEVLEHLEDDRALVARVPPGHRLLLTVPNFDSESHLRVFRSVSEVWRRYDRLVDFRRWVMVGSDRQGVHVCETRRRATSW